MRKHNMFLISPRKHMLWYSLEAPRQVEATTQRKQKRAAHSSQTR